MLLRLGRDDSPVEIEPNMDAWSKYHVALLFPSLAPAFYLCNHDRLRVARTRDAVVLAYRAMKEGFGVLKQLGYPLTPSSLKRFLWLPEPVMIAFLGKMLRDPRMEVAMEKHSEAAQDEIAQLIDEFMLLVDRSGLFTPNIQFMVSQFRLKRRHTRWQQNHPVTLGRRYPATIGVDFYLLVLVSCFRKIFLVEGFLFPRHAMGDPCLPGIFALLARPAVITHERFWLEWRGSNQKPA